MNVQCRDIQTQLAAFIDGDLPKAERTRVGEHLAACPVCRSEHEKLRQVTEGLRTMPEVACPERVVRKIEMVTVKPKQADSVRTKRASWWSFSRLKPVYLGVALMAIALVVVVDAVRNRDQTEIPTFSQEEALRMREEAKLSLAYIAQVMNKTEKNIVEDVLLKDIPKAVRNTIKNSMPLLGGKSR